MCGTKHLLHPGIGPFGGFTPRALQFLSKTLVPSLKEKDGTSPRLKAHVAMSQKMWRNKNKKTNRERVNTVDMGCYWDVLNVYF